MNKLLIVMADGNESVLRFALQPTEVVRVIRMAAQKLATRLKEAGAALSAAELLRQAAQELGDN